MISIKNLSFHYAKKKELFNELNLELSQGNIVGLLGKNGAGKTSLIKILTGLLYSKAGECQMLGETPSKRSPQFLSNVYFLPEEIEESNFRMDRHVGLYASFYPKFDHQVFVSSMTSFGIDPSENLKSLSYGQKKQFYISFGLATGCSLLVFDEPTNGLDIPSKSTFRKLVASNMTDDKLILISTHQVRDLGNLIDRVLVLNNGAIIFNKSTEDISNQYDFVSTDTVPDSTQWLYHERGLGSGKAIVRSQGNLESKIDLELLFSGIVSHPEKFKTTAHE